MSIKDPEYSVVDEFNFELILKKAIKEARIKSNGFTPNISDVAEEVLKALKQEEVT